MSKPSMSNSDGTIVSVQYLRALAAAMVLLEHISKKSGQVGHDIFSVLHFGYTGVDVFFVISGFIMSFVYARSEPGLTSFGSFWKRRFIRIVPLYWAVSLLALLVFLLVPEQVNSSGGVTVVWQSFALIPGDGQRFLIANGWTLSYEMYFYALFVFPFFIPNKVFGSVTSMLIIGALVSSHLLGIASGSFLTNPLILEFAFGIGVYLLYSKFRTDKFSTIGLGCIALGSAGLVLQQVSVDALPDSRFLTAGLPAAVLVYGMVISEATIRRFRFPLVEKLGDSSYSMYLSHPFPLKAAGLAFSYLGLARYGFWLEAIYWVAIAAFVLALGYFVYRYVEQPLIRWTRRIIDRTPTPAVTRQESGLSPS